MKTDVLIIGTGLAGSAIARELSKYDVDIMAVEASSDVGGATSKATPALVHSGWSEAPGSLKATLGVRSNKIFGDICKELDVPFERMGSLFLAFSEEDRKVLDVKMEQGIKNGVEGLRIVEGEELKKMEPNLDDSCIAALYAPSAAVTGPFELSIALTENACANGMKLLKEAPVTAIKKDGDIYKVETPKGTIEAKRVINCAGVYGDDIARMVGDTSFNITPMKGEIYLMDRNVGNLVNHPIETVSKGVVAVPTVHGNLIIGLLKEPSPKDNLDTTRPSFQKIYENVKSFLPDLTDKTIITSFAGLRPLNDRTDDYILEESEVSKGFFNVVIGTPGVFAVFGVAEYVVDLVKKSGIELKENKNFNPHREAIIDFRNMSNEEREEWVKKDPRYGRIICRCETVTEGQIVEAIRRGATTLDGIKYRTRCGMGRCQGGFCTPRILRIMQKELGVSITEITKKGEGSELMPYKVKEFLQ